MKERRGFSGKALTVLSVASVCIAVILAFTNLSSFSWVFSSLLRIASSMIYGFAFAYLMNPLVNFVDRLLYPALKRHGWKELSARRFSRVVGILFSMIVAFFLVYAVISLIVPQVVDSITGIVNNMPMYYTSVEKWVQNILNDNPNIMDYVNNAMQQGYNYLQNWVQNDLLANVQQLVVKVTTSIYSIIRELVNMVIGLVISVYVLLSKEKFLSQTKKIVAAVWRPERANRIMELGHRCNKIFSGFIVGKLIDSLIIGILCYIGMLILRLPYAVLIATIVGITNIIPYFGPIIGAVPSALLILLVNPLKSFYFIIFVFVLQQIDGNVLGPRILSGNVGISGFWVLVSITLGSGLFGFWGMILGVPVFAVIYMLISDAVSGAVRKRGYSDRTADYLPIRTVEDIPRAVPAGTPDKPPEKKDTPAEPPVSS